MPATPLLICILVYENGTLFTIHENDLSVSSLWADKHCCRCAFYKALGSMHQWLYCNYLGNVVINSEFNNIPMIKSVVGPYFRVHYNINIKGGSDQHDLFSIPLSRLN